MQTRALSEADENAIQTVRLLMFKETGGVKRYCFGVNGSSIQPVSLSETTFEAMLPAGEYDIAVLANAQDIVESCTVLPGDEKSAVLGALVKTKTGKWDGSTIPMWGRAEGVTVNGETGTGTIGPVEMVRMMARVDVEVSAGAQADFTLTSVRLYNYSSRGALVPDESTWPSGNLATVPTSPSAGGYGAVASPLVFDATDGVTADGCRRIIYTFESPAGSASTLSGNTCLVIGGSYAGGTASYYRVDFAGEVSGSPVFIPLLRNSCYMIKIVRVGGSGYSTPDEALHSPPVNMNTLLLQWTEKDMTNVVFDGEYMLGVSAVRLDLPGDAHTGGGAANRLTLGTTVPSGWTVEKITDASGMDGTAPWLTASRMSGGSGAAVDMYVLTTENTGASVRTGYIYIRSGNLRFCVEVNQSATPGFGVEVTDPVTGYPVETVDFGYQGGQTKQFRAVWKPSTARMTVYVTESGGGFSGSGLPVGTEVLAGGTKDYTVTGNTVTGDRYTRLDFTLTDGSRTAVRTVFVRQKQ
jgi:hypothetical protein